MNALKIPSSVLLLAGAAFGLYRLFGADVDAPPVARPPAAVPEPVVSDPTPIAPAAASRTPAGSDGRVEVDVGPGAGAEADQGVRGRVVLPGGGPAADVMLFLLQSTTADPLQLYLANKMRQKIQPVAQARTGPDGRFAIGINQVDQTFDLRVVSAEHPETQHKSIKIRAHDWYDTHDIQLEVGSVVQGHVVDEVGKFALANAQVFLTVPSLNHQMLPTPGRERGIVATTDSSGFFRFLSAPREGTITLGAEAPEYAYTEKPNLQVKADTPSEFTLELARGEPIAGVVVDQNGKPVAGATLTATAQSAKLPQVATATSGRDGQFRLPVLRPGPYQVVASAPNYEDVTEKPVFTGNEELKVVLEQRGRVRLRVLSARGVPIRAYTVALKRYFANNPTSIGKVPEFRDLRITPGDYEGEYATIRNVPNGDFVFQVSDNEHAKTLSPSFQMDGSKEPPTVEMTMTMGGAITGIVVDDHGQPVPGANVATDMNGGLAADTGFFQMFKSFLPDKHSTKVVQTDGGGRFVLNKLAFADYMLRVSHPDFCEGTSVDIKLETEGQMKDVGIVTLVRGAIVEGFCSFAGQRTGQIKVMIGPPDGYKPETDASGKIKGLFFSAQAITDNDGSYRFAKRIPPGTYKIHAFKEAGSDDVFGRFKQMKDTQRALVITTGQDRLQQNFDIPM